MELIHTSPIEIKEINTKGLFNDCLFFANEEYGMSDYKFVYSIEIDESKIIEVNELYNEGIIDDIMNALDVDEDAAERMLDGRDSAFDHGKDGEDDWWIQAKQGECAKLMGYEVCEALDEQGTAWIVPMMGRENDLKLVREC